MTHINAFSAVLSSALFISSACIAASAPVGSWAFDETGGTSAADSSGNALNFNLFGSPSWTTGQSAGALEFNGTTTYGRVANSSLLDGADKLTISLWVKPTGLNGEAQFIVSKRGSAYSEQAFSLFFGEGNKLFFDLNRSDSNGSGRFESVTTFQNDQWYQISLVYDGTTHLSQRARLYVNGKLDRQAPVPSTSIPHKNSDLFIGIGNAGYATKFKGVIDDLKISREIPTAAELVEAHEGMWLLERWYNLPYDDVEKLVADPKYYAAPSVTEYPAEGGADVELPYRGLRMRGLVEVPATGNYVFWLSASSSAELYLSDDSLPYGKQRIAKLSTAIGTDAGVKLSDPIRWDRFESQMSQPIALQAGTKYYIEIAGQTNHAGTGSHFHLAWAPEGGARTPIPGSALSYYVIGEGDRDDDSLPDVWETANGLDASDNGAMDVAKQGERGDFDADGLTNREEYLLGTDPRSKDTDGDGRSDSEEVRSYNSDPLVSNAPAETVVGTISLEELYFPGGEWMYADGGLIPNSFRGELGLSFTVPDDGVWLLQVGTRLRGTVYDSENVNVKVSVAGNYLGRYSLQFGSNHEALLRIVSPHLSQGTHQLKLEIENVIARRTVQILSVDVRRPTGSDDDSNGNPDWIDAMIAQTDSVQEHSTNSRISPFCLEGTARAASEVTVGSDEVLRGVDDSHWYLNLPLDGAVATPYSVNFASGLTAAGSVFWQPTNVLDGGILPVREGDSLKLGAWAVDGSGSASITISHSYASLPSGVSPGLDQDTLDPREGLGALRIPLTGNKMVRLSDSDELDGTSQLTISFSAKPDAAAFDGLPRGIVSKRVASNDNASYSVFIYTGGRLFVDLDVGTSTPLRIDTGYTMTTSWQDVKIVFDGTLAAAERLKVYVDGTLRKTASVSAGSVRNLSGNLVVGTLNNHYATGGATVGFGGLIDKVRITRAIPSTNESTSILLDFEKGTDLGFQKNTHQLLEQVTGTSTAIYTFGADSLYTIEAAHSGGAVATLTVPVRRALFDPALMIFQGSLRYWTLDANKVDPALVFQPGAGLRLGSAETVSASSYRFNLYPEAVGQLGVAARLWENGPIAGIAAFDSVGFSDATQNEQTHVETIPDFPDFSLITSPIVVSDLPEGGKIRITISRAGVFFADGTTVKIFTASDFVNGVIMAQFYIPSNLTSGGYCHLVDLIDASGNVLGRR